MKRILGLLAFVCSTTAVFAQGYSFERYWNGYGWAYRKVAYAQPVCNQPYCAPAVAQPVAEVKKETTIVNNLIGIPVPVAYTQPIAAQGTTVYGYSSVAESYNGVDMGMLYNQAARLTDQAQQLAGQAAIDFQALVQAEGANRAEVAKIIAQGQAAREALTAARGGQPMAPLIQRSFTFKVTQESSGEMKVERVEATPSTHVPDFNLTGPQALKANGISDLIKIKCFSCHGTDKAEGNLNFAQPISDAQQASVLERITTSDANKRMPRNGGKLTVSEMQVFFEAMGPKK